MFKKIQDLVTGGTGDQVNRWGVAMLMGITLLLLFAGSLVIKLLGFIV